MTYLNNNYGTRETPQKEKIPGSTQVKNNAGGYAWKVDKWDLLDRFLILGTEGGTYYVSERKLTVDNIASLLECIKEDGPRVVNRIVEISESGRAPKNDPALFALAVCAGAGDERTRKFALLSLPRVARIGTHLFHFVSYAEQFRGWGRGLRKAVGDWYTLKSIDDLAFQMMKYQQRDGWSHSDLLRLSHPKPGVNPQRKALYGYTVGKGVETAQLPITVQGFIEAMTAENEKDVINAIREYKLPKEMIPTKYMKSPAVWEALVPNLGYTAVIRNLGNMSKSGFLAQGKWEAGRAVVDKIANQEVITKSMVHPVTILSALVTYSAGHGFKGDGIWRVDQDVVDALDAAFYMAFSNVKPTGKRLVLGVDVSGSMGWEFTTGNPLLSSRDAAAAMLMVTYKVESNVVAMGFSDKLVELKIGRYSRLSEVIEYMRKIPYGNTDCSLLMQWASKTRVDVDGFIVYTDSETWFGKIHPVQALNLYRQKSKIGSKSVIVAMAANDISIADPEDPGMLDVVGFDTATPQVISDFIGRE